ncbi:MAG: Enoyl-CoA hydratase / Delta(3)-cis-delta(2)-trans-enoyl-CoA isomerase / 3-hydroxyacyl-CoA dehydrogenase / 3-hydroxybutyryl-CoA epimerase [uncultured Solirubrobacteraceae bacterium]|uniref:enoyl-CoA hydratase n=1 Tax=uncultured Solirubrobacteraceae bacterium TaxID=1162706 RepID=A0A6J4S7T1_9ACTN|nr:MAG: Enoyl-CoA hydratase / Delta(3)-cis-delta(2)-trans-enoyl-CoA isomerase / 3-hydroxyacyl-CoA dehydrogenase / 3-hydroxybutyryl-CoA epimerase [uncultured Solirubrobacteraceae bacterium]
MSTEASAGAASLGDRVYLKALVEACRVLEEGVAGMRDIDVGMRLGIGMDPGPFARADAIGLDSILQALGHARERWGAHFEAPLLLRRLVAQGRLGRRSGQGFYAYPAPDPGYEDARVKLERRGAVAVVWLDNPPANVLTGQVVDELRQVWDEIHRDPAIRAMLLTSAHRSLFSAGADIGDFPSLDERGGQRLIDRAHSLLRAWEHSGTMTVAAVNGPAVGGGCELVMACDVRLAAHSATFAQPEVKLGIMPGFGGSQRLPRLVGHAKALEMNAIGEPIAAEEAYEFGLANRLVADHELFDTALLWARRLASQAPLALRELKLAAYEGDIDRGLAAEKVGFATLIDSADAHEGAAAFLERRPPRFRGR